MYISEEYLKYHNKYVKTYGQKTLVFMQVGSFYEAYSTDIDGPNLLEISKIIGVIRSRKNKKDPKISNENPYFLGFPIVSINKFLEILMNNDYIVVIVDQFKNENITKKKREERKVSNIYSKGTYIENIEKKEGNYIVCLFISHNEQKNGKNLISIGMTSVDVSTGYVYIHEAYSSKYDENYAFDEADRFINTLSPKEILIYSDDTTKNINLKKNRDIILNCLKLDFDKCKYFDVIDKKYFELNFQNEMLNNVYKSLKTLISPIELLDLSKNIFTILSMVLIFDYIYDKNKYLLNKLHKPIFLMNNKHLLLGNNAIRQLDIIDNNNKSLFNIINKTSTALGERFLKSRLTAPLTNKDDLNKSYDLIDILMKNNLYKELEIYLENIKDVERLQRKIELNIIKPFELCMFIQSYENIILLIEKCQNNELLKSILPQNKNIKNIREMIKYVYEKFNLNELEKYTNYDFQTQIFNVNIYKDIDEIKNNVNSAHEVIEELRKYLNNLLSQTSNNYVSVKHNNRDGYYLNTTHVRANLLKDKVSKTDFKILNKVINKNMLDFQPSGKSTKIYFKSLDQTSDNIEKYNDEFMNLNKKHYLEELIIINKKFYNNFNDINYFVAFIDFLKSNAKTALLFSYFRPTIINNDFGYVNATKLRHPIIERLIDYEYIPHNICIGNDKTKGILLYGLNSSGKSSLMKAVGLSVIMAQSGMFVPSEKYELSIYNELYTRISGDDNIFKGLSSFAVEMIEVNAILKRVGCKSLVIGDEICRGTEYLSGNAIVATTILKLVDLKSTFIFATHLHELMKIEEIKKLQNVKAFHISVKYDEKTNMLIYDRELTEGSGEAIYGLTFAQFIIQDKEFIDNAIKIKNQLLNISGNMIDKTSKYNKNVLVYKCAVCDCNEKLETHHINFQKDCVDGHVKHKKHILKNQESNLIVLCDKCHDKIHSGKLNINKFVMSSNGKAVLL